MSHIRYIDQVPEFGQKNVAWHGTAPCLKKWHDTARKAQLRYWRGTARLYDLHGTDGTGIFEKNMTKIQVSAPKIT